MLAPRVAAQPQASLCLPTSLGYFAALIARANRVCPTLGASFSCLHALMPFLSAQRHKVRLCPACAGASSTHVCSARYLQPPPYVPPGLPATYYVLLLPFPRASAICVCAKSHARCPSTPLVLLFLSLPCAPYTTFPHALTLSPLLNVGRGPAPWPDKQLCVAVSSSCRCFKHSCLRHT